MTFRGGKAGGGGFSSLAFEPLPGAVKEVEGVSAIWSRKTKEECLLLEGKAASETAVKHEAPGKRVLHLATHGFFLGDGPPSSYRDDEGIDAVAAASASDPDHPPRLENENSLFRTGLAFAGANRREAAPEGQDDGILTAQEIATLDLRGVEWAVLSACDTGAGEVRTGEGVFGLRRAFQVAGARMLVMSLWPVEDEEARAWMQIFYEARFGSGLAVAEAARRASLALLRESRAAGKRGHPAGWAAFVAAGDWR